MSGWSTVKTGYRDNLQVIPKGTDTNSLQATSMYPWNYKKGIK